MLKFQGWTMVDKIKPVIYRNWLSSKNTYSFINVYKNYKGTTIDFEGDDLNELKIFYDSIYHQDFNNMKIENIINYIDQIINKFNKINCFI